MFEWNHLLRLGDLSLTLPAAAAMTAWLAAARAWRMAFWWSLLFGAGITLVGASKIAFLGWGAGLPALGFKSVSGHAVGVTAIFPTLFYLLLEGRAAALRNAGVVFGLGLGLLVGVLLVVLDEHSAAEAAAGCAMGALVSLGWIRLAGGLPQRAPLRSLVCFTLVFLAAAWLMNFAHIGYWMIRAARLLSGNHNVYPLDCGAACG
jgi:hypothetical protein